MPIENDNGNPPKGMRYFAIYLYREASDSLISFVAAMVVKAPKKTLNRLLECKFPGWTWEIDEVDRDWFEGECENTRRVAEIDWNVRHSDLMFQKISQIQGNLFDPEWFK